MTVKLVTADLASEKIIANLLLNFSNIILLSAMGSKCIMLRSDFLSCFNMKVRQNVYLTQWHKK